MLLSLPPFTSLLHFLTPHLLLPTGLLYIHSERAVGLQKAGDKAKGKGVSTEGELRRSWIQQTRSEHYKVVITKEINKEYKHWELWLQGTYPALHIAKKHVQSQETEPGIQCAHPKSNANPNCESNNRIAQKLEPGHQKQEPGTDRNNWNKTQINPQNT